IRILGPLVWSTISPETVTLDRASDSEVTDAPSTTRIGDSDTAVPASPSIFSTLTRSPSATLYCLPPVLTIAYMEGFPLLLGCVGTCGDHTGCAVFSACSPALTGQDRRFRRPLWSRPRFLARRHSAVTSDLSRLRRRGTAGQTGHAAGPSPLAVAPLGGDGRPCRAPARGPGPGRGDHRRGRRRALVAPAPGAGACVAGSGGGRAGCAGACASVSAVSTAATALSASAATAASSVAGALSSVPAVTSSVVGFACAAPSPAARRDDRRRERVPDPEDSTDAVVVAAAPASGFPEPEGAGSDCVPEDSSCRPIARAARCAVGAGPSFLGVCLGVSDWPLPPLPPLPPRRRPRRPPGSSSLWDSVWT